MPVFVPAFFAERRQACRRGSLINCATGRRNGCGSRRSRWPNASQLVGYPTQYPSVSLVDWETGQPNARFWVLKLLKDHFSPGDQLVRTPQPGPFVYAQAFLSTGNKRRLLLVNRRNRDMEITIPGAVGAAMRFVDQTTAFQPPSSTTLKQEVVRLGGYAVAVVEFAQ